MNPVTQTRQQLLAELQESRRTVDDLQERCSLLSSRLVSRGKTGEERSEDRWREAVEGTGEGLWNWNIQTGEEWWSKRFYELLGYRDGEIESKFATFLELLHPEDKERGPDAVRAHLEERVPFDIELRLRCKSGEYRWFRSHALTRWNENGEPLSMAGAIEDITARKRSLRALQKSEREFQLLAENIPGLFCYMGADGRYKFINSTYARWFRFDRDEAIGKHYTEVLPAQLCERIAPHVEAVLAGEPTFFEVPPLPYLNRSDRWGKVSYVPYKLDGVVEGFFSLVLDITHDKRADKELRDSEARFRDLYQNAPDMFASIEASSGRIVECNKALAEATGFSKEEILGFFNISELYHPESEERRTQVFEEFVKTGEVRDVDLRLRRADGSPLDVSLSLTATRDESGEISHSRSVWRDTSHRKKAQEAERLSNQAKSEFLANMSHEIRTPINGITGLSRLLLKDEHLNPTTREYAELLQSSAQNLLEVVDDVLDFSRIEAGKLELEAVDFELASLVRDTVEMLEPRARVKHDALRLEISEDLPAVVRGDRSRLRQVLINLLSNATKFTSDGSIEIAVAPLTANSIRFSVTDTGIGISHEKQAGIFEAFTQGDSSTSRRFGGSGLGLTICKQLVELMGGSIGFESTPGSGSHFWFTARLTAVDDRPERPSTAMIGETESPFVGRRVLLVEDEYVNRIVALRELHDLGLAVDSAKNGREALNAFEQERYDLVLMDCQMPELDGYAATREIRKQEQGSQHIPIIAVTASANEEERERSVAAGMDDFITKPYREEVLLAILERWLRKEGEGSSEKRDDGPSTAAATLDLETFRYVRTLLAKQGAFDSCREELMTPKWFERIRRAVTQGERKEVATIAHKLSGTAANSEPAASDSCVASSKRRRPRVPSSSFGNASKESRRSTKRSDCRFAQPWRRSRAASWSVGRRGCR